MKKTILLLLTTILFMACQNDFSKAYTFLGKNLCEDDIEIRLLDRDSLIRFGREKTYAKKIIVLDDSIAVNFKVITSCCLTPSDSLTIKNDSIIIQQKFSGRNPCDCFCDYEFNYKISKKISNGKTIVIH